MTNNESYISYQFTLATKFTSCIWVFEAQIIFGICYIKIVFLQRFEFIIHLQVMSEKQKYFFDRKVDTKKEKSNLGPQKILPH
jgi:hypothetical protein